MKNDDWRNYFGHPKPKLPQPRNISEPEENEMRPYRGIPIGGKEFVYGWYVHLSVIEKHFIVPSDSTISICAKHGKGHFGTIEQTGNYCWPCEVIPETVGQQVGLKDKNVYADDIITFYPIDRSTGVLQTARVCYDERRTAFCVKSKAWDCPLSFCRKIEVVGNYHQNPNLLEQGNGR